MGCDLPRRRTGHQRFTRPTRDVVIFAVFVPRRNRTVVLAVPQPTPVGPKITELLDTDSETACQSGPGERHTVIHRSSPHSSTRSESAAIVNRARVARNTAALRAMAKAVVTSDAVRSTAIRSKNIRHPGNPNAVVRPAIASTMANSTNE
jgi:hypothetical protein